MKNKRKEHRKRNLTRERNITSKLNKLLRTSKASEVTINYFVHKLSIMKTENGNQFAYIYSRLCDASSIPALLGRVLQKLTD